MPFCLYPWVWTAYFDPWLIVYSCILPLHMYLAWLIQQEKKNNNIFIFSQICLPHKQRLSTDIIHSLRRERHQNIWDPWWRMWQGKADAYVVTSQGWVSSFSCSIQRWLGGKESRNLPWLPFGTLPSEWVIWVIHQQSTRFVSSLNYKSFNRGKAKALMLNFPCVATQNTESSLDYLVTYVQNCVCACCAIHICVR